MVLQFPIAVGVESLAVVFFFGFAKSCQAEHVLLPIYQNLLPVNCNSSHVEVRSLT